MHETAHPVLTERFVEALEFANKVHAQQTRKGTSIPYVSHLLGVASLVLEHGADEDCAIAALLHDAPEDQGGRHMLTQIEDLYGRRVARIVEGCTDTFEDPKPEYGRRKEKYVAHLATADSDTCLVSAADKVHNARAILHDLRTSGEALWQRFSGTSEQIGWYYGAIAEAFAKQLVDASGRDLVAELNAVLQQIEQRSPTFAAGIALGRSGSGCPANDPANSGADSRRDADGSCS